MKAIVAVAAIALALALQTTLDQYLSWGWAAVDLVLVVVVFALVLTRREVTTFPVQVTHYFGGQSNFWAKIAAMSVLGTVPIFVAVAIMQRYLVRGISLGAVKG